LCFGISRPIPYIPTTLKAYTPHPSPLTPHLTHCILNLNPYA